MSEKLLSDVNFKYTYKYALWDYIKSLKNLEVRQIVNLAQIFAVLMAKQIIPLHFLKVIDFEAIDKPTVLMMLLLLENILSECANAD